jgi:predicted xylan-binding protein with Ca-dependent carbohydrate-binding module
MATAVWDSGTWSISNGGLTATSPNTGQLGQTPGGSINEEDASIALPDNAKTYYEFQVSGAALYTAFGVGFGELGANDGGYSPGLVSSNSVPKGAPELEFSYNLAITEGQSIVYDPQANAPQPPPNQWANGATIGIEVDRIDNTAQFFLNGVAQGGPINISAMAGETLYPMVSSWFLAGPQATINGNPSDTPAGYTNLDDVGSQTAPPPPPPPPPTVTIGSGPDTLALQISEDEYLGNALFTVSVDGQQIGGTQTATALHSSGQTQTFDVLGTFDAGSHTVTVDFLNDAYGGSPSTDRNLYVDGATIDGSVVSGATLTEHFQGPQSFTFVAPGTSGSGSTADTVTVNRPAALIAGVQTITGTESDPSQSIFLDWRTYGTPVIGDSDWVRATVTSSGSFSAAMTIDHAGTQSTMFYRIGSGPTIAAWSGTPS